ncbi:MAG: hypothetical protein ACLSA6_14710 [Holdemania massiliensis]
MRYCENEYFTSIYSPNTAGESPNAVHLHGNYFCRHDHGGQRADFLLDYLKRKAIFETGDWELAYSELNPQEIERIKTDNRVAKLLSDDLVTQN